MSIAFVPFYIHYLGIEAYGVVGVFALLQSALFIFDLGITPTLSREIARFQSGAHTAQSIGDLVRSLEVIYLGIALIIAVSMGLSGPWISRHWLQVESLAPGDVGVALSLTGVYVALRWFAGLYRAAIAGLQKIVWLNMCSSAFATLRGAGVLLVLAFIAPTIRAFLIYQCIASAAEVVVLGKLAHSQLPAPSAPVSFRLDALYQVWRFAAGMSVNMVQVLLLTQIDKLILSRLLSLSQFGYYTLASTVAGGIFILIGSITSVAYPRFSLLAAQSQTAAIVEIYHKMCQLVTIIAVPISMILAMFASTVLYLWTRNTALATATAPILTILVMGNLFNSLTQIPYYLQLAYGWTRLNLIVNFVSLLVLVPSIYYAVPKYGILAAPTIWLVMNIGWVLIAVPAMHTKLIPSEMWKWYKSDVGIPTFAAIASIGFVHLFYQHTNTNKLANSLIFLCLAVLLGYSSTIATTSLGRDQTKKIIQLFLNGNKKPGDSVAA